MQCFLVLGTGETKELKSDEHDGKKIKDFLESTECYIIVDDRERIVYLWKGKDSRIRSKFIGAKKSQEVRGQVGLNYKVVPVDQGEETAEFLAAIDMTTEPGYAKEIKEEGEGPAFLKDIDTSSGPRPAPPAAAPQPAAAAPQPPAPRFAPTYVSPENTGPLYTGAEVPGDAGASAEPPADFAKVLETLENLENPPGYEREMVIIGNQTYSIVEKVQVFLGKKMVKREMEPIGALPEGVFFAEGYAPRVLCENGKVLSIEFFKRVGPEPAPVKAGEGGPKVLKEAITGKSPEELAKAFGFRTKKE
ncbi:MAG: hypothetical protein Kow0069_17430 [Promethearchaeota archaeon]